MQYPEFKYTELHLGFIGDRDKVCEVDQVAELVNKSQRRECYRSLFRHSAAIIEHIKAHTNPKGKNTVAGYTGVVFTDYLPFDIDREGQLDVALQDTRDLIQHLRYGYEIPYEAIKVFFTGAKGFNILLPSNAFNLEPSSELPGLCKRLALELAGKITIDVGLYEHMRLFRITDTINKKSGLYKIELAPNELMTQSIDDMKELAKKPRFYERVDYDHDKIEGELAYLVEKVNISHTESRQTATETTRNDYVTILSGVERGGRTQALTRLYGHFWSKGIPLEEAIRLCELWDANNPYGSLNMDYGPNKVRKTGEDIYRTNGQQANVEDAEELSTKALKLGLSCHGETDTYNEHLRDRWELGGTGLKTGFKRLDNATDGLEGLIVIGGTPGAGKTSSALQVSSEIARRNEDTAVLFYELEMSRWQLRTRIMSRLSEVKAMTLWLGSWEKNAAGKYGRYPGLNLLDNEKYQKACAEFSQYSDRLWLMDWGNTVMNVKVIQEHIRQALELEGISRVFVCVDHLQIFPRDARTDSMKAQIDAIVGDFRRIVDQTGATVMLISQQNRQQAGRASLQSYMGSAEIEYSADLALMLSAEYQETDPEKMLELSENKPDQDEKSSRKNVKLCIMKNRDGATGKLNLVFSPEYYSFSEA